MTDTKEKIMEVARAMVQARGYSALSFRDLAEAVGVKSASVHYHFATKGDLAAALAQRYAQDGDTAFAAILAAAPTPQAFMRRYTDVFRSALANDNRMCLCGIMAAEYDLLPAEVRKEVDGFTEVNVAWLSRVLALHTPLADADALRSQALAIFAAIEGAQLLARSRGDIAVFDQTVAAYRSAGLLP